MAFTSTPLPDPPSTILSNTVIGYVPYVFFCADRDEPVDISVLCQRGKIEIEKDSKKVTILNPETYKEPIPCESLSFTLTIHPDGSVYLSDSSYNDDHCPHYQERENFKELILDFDNNTIQGLEDIPFWDKYGDFDPDFKFRAGFFMRSGWKI